MNNFVLGAVLSEEQPPSTTPTRSLSTTMSSANEKLDHPFDSTIEDGSSTCIATTKKFSVREYSNSCSLLEVARNGNDELF
jgi:hypothetical protein